MRNGGQAFPVVRFPLGTLVTAHVMLLSLLSFDLVNGDILCGRMWKYVYTFDIFWHLMN